VVRVRWRQAQLAEDVADMLLYRAVGDAEDPGDRAVGAALCHQREHLALPAGEGGEAVGVPASTSTLIFTYTASGVCGVEDGAVRLTVPQGWTPPTNTPGTAGYTTASLGQQSVSVSDATITVSGVTLGSGQTLSWTRHMHAARRPLRAGRSTLHTYATSPAAQEHPESPRSSRLRTSHGGVGRASLSARIRMCSGPTPQHPPMSCAPWSAQAVASWRYSPGVRPSKTQFGAAQPPDSA
jgi:hypothetical protein